MKTKVLVTDNMKKICSILLCLSLLFAVLPVGVFASAEETDPAYEFDFSACTSADSNIRFAAAMRPTGTMTVSFDYYIPCGAKTYVKNSISKETLGRLNYGVKSTFSETIACDGSNVILVINQDVDANAGKVYLWNISVKLNDVEQTLSFKGQYGATYKGITVGDADIPETSSEIGGFDSNIDWQFLPQAGIFTVSGTGAMENYTSSESVPWQQYLNMIKTLVIETGITAIGDYAFDGCTQLKKVCYLGSQSEWNAVSVGLHNVNFEIAEHLYNVRVCDIKNHCYGSWVDEIPATCTENGVKGYWECSVCHKYFDSNENEIQNLLIPAIGHNYVNRTCTLCGDTQRTVIDSGSCGTNLIWEYDDNNVLTISGTGGMANYNSTSAPWYSYRNSIKTVNIGNGVITIGDYAFAWCTGLTSITIPDSITSIGGAAFHGCTGLTSVTIPNSVTTIGYYVFYNCTGLTSVTIPNSVTTIGSYAFDGTAWYNNQPAGMVYAGNVAYKYKGICPSTVVLRNDTVGIANYAFGDCTGLTNITIPDSVTTIGSAAFYGCTGLTGVYITDLAAWCNISFHDNPLEYAHNLYLNGELVTDLVIPQGVTKINNFAFYGCTNITSITIPNTVTTIGSSAFYRCIKLLSITIPDSVTTIDVRAFCDCTGLTSVTIGNSVTAIGDSAFNNCMRLTEINWNAKAVADVDYDVFYKAGTAGDGIIVTFDDSVEKIPANLFRSYDDSYRPKVKSVTIGNSVSTIGSLAFYNCTDLTGVYINDVAAWCNISFIGTNPLYYAHNLYLNGELVTNLVIPQGVTKIKDYAFDNCTSLTSVTVPDVVTTIGRSAFNGCSSLTSVTVPASVTSIGYDAFSGCPVTIYGEAGSEAERYAAANVHTFVAKPEKIKIFSKPDKLIYNIGEPLDLEGTIIAVYYPNGLLEWRYKGFEISGFDSRVPGTKTVTLTYLGASTTFTVTVERGAVAPIPTTDDMVRLMRALLGKEEISASADYNADGAVDVRDLVRAKKMLAA